MRRYTHCCTAALAHIYAAQRVSRLEPLGIPSNKSILKALISLDARGRKSRLNAADKAAARKMIDNGLSDEEIGCALGVHRTTALRLRHEIQCESANDAEPETGSLAHFLWRTEKHLQEMNALSDLKDFPPHSQEPLAGQSAKPLPTHFAHLPCWLYARKPAWPLAYASKGLIP